MTFANNTDSKIVKDKQNSIVLVASWTNAAHISV